MVKCRVSWSAFATDGCRKSSASVDELDIHKVTSFSSPGWNCPYLAGPMPWSLEPWAVFRPVTSDETAKQVPDSPIFQKPNHRIPHRKYIWYYLVEVSISIAICVAYFIFNTTLLTLMIFVNLNALVVYFYGSQFSRIGSRQVNRSWTLAGKSGGPVFWTLAGIYCFQGWNVIRNQGYMWYGHHEFGLIPGLKKVILWYIGCS